MINMICHTKKRTFLITAKRKKKKDYIKEYVSEKNPNNQLNYHYAFKTTYNRYILLINNFQFLTFEKVLITCSLHVL